MLLEKEKVLKVFKCIIFLALQLSLYEDEQHLLQQMALLCWAGPPAGVYRPLLDRTMYADFYLRFFLFFAEFIFNPHIHILLLCLFLSIVKLFVPKMICPASAE